MLTEAVTVTMQRNAPAKGAVGTESVVVSTGGVAIAIGQTRRQEVQISKLLRGYQQYPHARRAVRAAR